MTAEPNVPKPVVDPHTQVPLKVPDDFGLRNKLGVGVTVLAGLLGTGALIWAKCVIPDIPSYEWVAVTTDTSTYGYMIVGMHAAITITSVWWMFQMLKIGERMMAPRDLVQSASDMLGVRTSPKEVADQQKRLASNLTDRVSK